MDSVPDLLCTELLPLHWVFLASNRHAKPPRQTSTPFLWPLAQTLVWGCPRDGALGLKGSKTGIVRSPTASTSALGSVEITHSDAGQAHSVWLDSSGRVWACGRNKEGQCGAPLKHTTLDTPSVIASMSHLFATQVAAGALSTAIVADGRLYEVGFVVSSLKSKAEADAEAGGSSARADDDEEGLQDAMESMVQLTGLASRLRERPGLRRLVLKSNLAYMTAKNRRHILSDGVDVEDEAVTLYMDRMAATQVIAAEREEGGQAAEAPAQAPEEDEEGLEQLARGIMRMQARRTPTAQPLLADELVEAGVTVVKVAMGYGHTVVVDSEGRAWSKGYNDRGQLGQEHRITTPYFRRMSTRMMPKDAVIVDVACGTSHTLLRTADGQVYACGSGGLGQLGQVRRGDRLLPVRVTWCDPLYTAAGCDEAASIAAGANHSIIVDASGAVWTFGHSEYSQMTAPGALVEAAAAATAATVEGGSSVSGSGGPGSASAGGMYVGDRTVDARFYYQPRRMEGTGMGPGCVVRAAAAFSGCVANYTMVTSDSGQLLSFGWNAWGVLGRKADLLAREQHGGSIFVAGFGEKAGLPVRSVGCGQNHVALVTEPRGHRFARAWRALLTEPALTASTDALALALDSSGSLARRSGIPFHAGILAARCPALVPLLRELCEADAHPPSGGHDTPSHRVKVLVIPRGDMAAATAGWQDVPTSTSPDESWLGGVLRLQGHTLAPGTTSGRPLRSQDPGAADGAASGAGVGFALQAAPGSAAAGSAFCSPGSPTVDAPAVPLADRTHLVLVFPHTPRRALQALVEYLYTDVLRCPPHHMPALGQLAEGLGLARLTGLVAQALVAGSMPGGEDDATSSGTGLPAGPDSQQLLELATQAARAAREFFAAKSRQTVAAMEAAATSGSASRRRPQPLSRVKRASKHASASSRVQQLSQQADAVLGRVKGELAGAFHVTRKGADGKGPAGATPPAPPTHKELSTTIAPAPSKWVADMRAGGALGLFPDVALMVSGAAEDGASPTSEVFFAHAAVVMRYEFFERLLSSDFQDVSSSPYWAKGAGAPALGTSLAPQVRRATAKAATINDIAPSIFRLVLDWVYAGDSGIVTGENCLDLLAAACRLGIHDLTAVLEGIACDNCVTDNAHMLAEFAQVFALPRLAAFTRQVLREAGMEAGDAGLVPKHGTPLSTRSVSSWA